MNLVCQTCRSVCERTGQRQRNCPPWAKGAAKIRAKAWREANIESVRVRDRARIDPDYNRQKAREWHANNPAKAKENAARWYVENKDKAIARATNWASNNPEKRGEIRNASAKRLRASDPERFREAKQERRKDPGVRLHDSISAAIRISLRGRKAGASWEGLVGYSIDQLMAHLERKFADGMSWDNYGEWHIDHCRPVASFEFRSAMDDDFKECWTLSNLQPLWAIDNMKKNSWWNGARAFRDAPENRAAMHAAEVK